MGRKKRTEAEKGNAKKWRAALYVRLSKEDGGDESMSVGNQKEILTRYVAELDDGDEYIVQDIYTDDGQTGTDYDRREFKRMLRDIQSGNVNLVIVKDLSRPFRNYADQGYFLEDFFPRHDVRFISLGLPPLDSCRNPEMMNNIAVPIQGVINDNHCRETSLKVRQVFDMKRRRGQFIGAFAPYGYMKDPKDKNSFIIDEEAAGVVRDIYSWFIGGMSKNGIVHALNGLGIPCPSAYKRSRGMNYRNPNAGRSSLWSLRTVTKILRDQTYTGDMVQGRFRIKSYKIHTQIETPPEEWFIAENTHEPVIDRRTFEKARDLQNRDARAAPQKPRVYLFSGFLRCADCGKSVIRHTGKPGAPVYYYCSTYKNRSKAACTKHAVRHDRLEEALLLSIQHLIFSFVSFDEIISAINSAPESPGSGLDSMIASRGRELEKIALRRQALYEDWKNGDISREDHKSLRAGYEEQAENLRRILSDLTEKKNSLEKNADTENPFLARFREHQNIDALTREMLAELVDKIVVHERGDITIRFKFADGYLPAAGLAEGRIPEG